MNESRLFEWYSVYPVTKKGPEIYWCWHRRSPSLRAKNQRIYPIPWRHCYLDMWKVYMVYSLYGGKKSPLISVHVANRYITWLNWAKSGSAKSGTWPMSSWIMSGSGVYKGLEPCLIYWVAWKTRKASPARKSREEIRPATGRRLKPEHSKSWYSK